MEGAFRFAERLSEMMVGGGVTNASLAKAIGVHVTTVQRWRNGSTCLSRKNLVAIADYFHCSMEFLVGRSEVVLDFSPQSCPPFYNRLREIMAKKNISRYRLQRDTTVKDSYFTFWKKGGDPRLFSLIDLSDYLGITLDYLVGRDR